MALIEASVLDDSVKVIIAVVFFVVALGSWFSLNRTRYPDAPWLRVSKRPSLLGTLEDRTTLLSDPMAILSVGWERYSKHGLNYMLDTAEGPRYVVAQKYFEELTRAPDTHVMQTEHTLHPIVATDQYHFDLPIKKSLTQALGPKLPAIVEEGKLAIDQYIGFAKDWTSRDGLESSFNVVTRTANRLLFNIDLTRNLTFHQLSIDYTFVMFGGADKVRKWPELLKPLVMWWSTNLYKTQNLARSLIMPLLEQRVKDEKIARVQGTIRSREREDDMVQWILDYTSDEELVPSRLFYRMLHINVAAVHTSSTTFADVLYSIAIFSQYQDELREEIVHIFRQERGWSKQALTFLTKMDSFITECGRLQSNAALKNFRYVLKDWTFKDGTKVPAGTAVFSNQLALHLDNEYFSDAQSFNPWRMHKLRMRDGEATKHQYVMTGENNLHFGHGKHACPGRFFAANEIKTLLVLYLMRYDLRLRNMTYKEIQQGRWFQNNRLPVNRVAVEFRNRSHLLDDGLKEWFL